MTPVTGPREQLLARLVAEQHNGGGWVTPPAVWNASGSTAVLLGHGKQRTDAARDDELTIARRRKVLTDAYTEDQAATG